jgi:hypothetical protein
MKNLFRAFALSLVVTGAYASTHTNDATKSATHAKVSALPIPQCPPGDPNGCNVCAFTQCVVN